MNAYACSSSRKNLTDPKTRWGCKQQTSSQPQTPRRTRRARRAAHTSAYRTPILARNIFTISSAHGIPNWSAALASAGTQLGAPWLAIIASRTVPHVHVLSACAISASIAHAKRHLVIQLAVSVPRGTTATLLSASRLHGAQRPQAPRTRSSAVNYATGIPSRNLHATAPPKLKNTLPLHDSPVTLQPA